jgi:hypothetical protein
VEQVFEAQTPPEVAPSPQPVSAADGKDLTKREQRIAEKKRQEELRKAAKAAEQKDGTPDDERIQLVNELKSVLALADQRRPRARLPLPDTSAPPVYNDSEASNALT